MNRYIIKNATIIDGTGKAAYKSDIIVEKGLIKKISSSIKEEGEIIDASGLVLTPGFIDSHSHSDLLYLQNPDNSFKLKQGVTTEIVGLCGFGPIVYSDKSYNEILRYNKPIFGDMTGFKYNDISNYINSINNIKPIINIASFVAHGPLRLSVVGTENRKATDEELETMKELLTDGMKKGAVGLSLGLAYYPGIITPIEELIELSKVVKKYDGVVSVHLKDEADDELDALNFIISVIEQSKVKLNISHMKTIGKNNYGNVKKMINIIEKAIAEKGLDISFDIYPYEAGSTTIVALLPLSIIKNGLSNALEILRDPTKRELVRKDILNVSRIKNNGWETIYINGLNNERNKKYIGKNLQEISKLRNEDVLDTFINLIIEEKGIISIIQFYVDENDIIDGIKSDLSMVISDSIVTDFVSPHPRAYGSFAKLINKYVKEKNTLTIEEAIRKITSLPASRYGLLDRGIIKENGIADIVIFDLNEIKDNATYIDSTKESTGIKYIFVNGELIISNGIIKSKRNGKFISNL